MLDKISLHNIDSVEKIPIGYKLSRYPQKVIESLNEYARVMSGYSCGTEGHLFMGLNLYNELKRHRYFNSLTETKGDR